MATADHQSGSEKKIVLRIKRSEEEEEEEFMISESGAALSEKLKKILEDGAAADGVITLSNVRKYTVPMIIDYLETHATATDRACRDFDREFALGKDHYFIKGILLDAYTLKVKQLVNLLVQKLVDYSKPKSMKYRHIWLTGREPTTEEKERWRRILPDVDWDEQRRLEQLDEPEEQLAKANIRFLI